MGSRSRGKTSHFPLRKCQRKKKYYTVFTLYSFLCFHSCMNNSVWCSSTLLFTFSLPVEAFMFSFWCSSRHGLSAEKWLPLLSIWLTFRRIRKITWSGFSCSCTCDVDKSTNIYSYEIQVLTKACGNLFWPFSVNDCIIRLKRSPLQTLQSGKAVFSLQKGLIKILEVIT